jgi:hemolysin-activating ACP:hemolysin acyltransferase
MAGIGTNQQGMLRVLEMHDGFWHAGCGWNVVNNSNTERLLKTLESHGLVRSEQISTHDRMYVIVRDAPFGGEADVRS